MFARKRNFRTLFSDAFRVIFKSIWDRFWGSFWGHFGACFDVPGGSQKTFKIDPKMDRILGAKTLVFHLFLKQKWGIRRG